MWNNYTYEDPVKMMLSVVTYIIGPPGSDLLTAISHQAFNTLDVDSSIDPKNVGELDYSVRL